MTKRGWAAGVFMLFVALNGGCGDEPGAQGGEEEIASAATIASHPHFDTDVKPVPTHDVIVVLRDQLAGTPPQRRAMQGRSSALASAQNAVLARLPANGQRKKTHFQTINAFATTATADESDLLAQDPDVLAVVPDRVIRMTNDPSPADAPVPGPSAAGAAPAPVDPSQLCNTLEPQALQLTRTAFLDPTIPQAQQLRDGNGQLVTGRGVKIAYIADRLDPNVAGFTRPDGTSVFIDFQDFSGDPAGTPNDGREAFLDASSIAAQDNPGGTPLNFDISTYTNAAAALPSPCNIRIRGMSPGASLVGLSIFSQLGTLSTLVKAIEYAVVVDDVDIINESFAASFFPDEDVDPLSLANKAAVQAGVTVVVATGDAGPGSTIGVPASNSGVIAAGATTQLRVLAQTGGSVSTLATGGYVDNDIASFSSSGFTQKTGRTIDVVAPGHDGWALCSPNTALFTGCLTRSSPRRASSIEIGNGTSEAAPFIAGEAALVIQAYRSTHGGRSPDPSLIKQIIMSTATDLGAPPEEQGAGLINALSAVYAALAASGAHGPSSRPAGARNSVLVTADPGSFTVTDMPGAPRRLAVTLTNLGSQPQVLSPTLLSLSEKVASGSQTLAIDTTSGPTFLDEVGRSRAYVPQSIDVPANVDHLDVSVSYPTTIGSPTNPFVTVALIDPSGRLVTDSVVQGLDNGFQHVEAVRPTAGTWTAIVYTLVDGFVNSYSGAIQFSWAAQRMEGLGSVSPSHLKLAPGASATLTASFSMPSSPGDSAATIRLGPLTSEDAPNSSIPLSLRTLVPVSSQGAVFFGTLTGGNFRQNAGPTHFYSFDVPPGVKDMNLILDVADSGFLLQGMLIDPHGLPYSINSNEDPITGAATSSMQFNRYDPTPGRWQFSLTEYFVTSGLQTESPFSASLVFNAAPATANGLPNSDRVALSASAAPLSVPIVVTNNSRTTQMYFADARRSTSARMDLLLFPSCSDPPILPYACAFSYVPTQSRSIAFGAQSAVPVAVEASDFAGTIASGTATYSPTILGQPNGTNGATADLVAREIPYGGWAVFPALIGPFESGGAGAYPVSFSATAITRDFDTAMIADSGDEWEDLVTNGATFNPLVLEPGQSGTITVRIQPDADKVGKVVSGDIFIDTFNFVQFNGDEVARIPYRYRVGK